MIDERLAAKVRAVNRMNTVVNTVHPLLHNFFKDYVGKKILRADGELLKSVKDKVLSMLEPIEAETKVRFYRDKYETLLCYSAKTSENIKGDCTCLYHEDNMTLGVLDCGVLMRTNDHHLHKLRTDYDEEEIRRKREVCEKLKEQARNAESDLHPFGLYTR